MSKESEQEKSSYLKQAVELTKLNASTFKEKAVPWLKSKSFRNLTTLIGSSLALGVVSGGIGTVVIPSISLAVTAGGIVKDIIDVRSTRLLKKENDMLAKFVDSSLQERKILANNPDLARVLDGTLIS